MTAQELQQRNEKADHLRVLKTDDGQFFVESGEGKILYNVTVSDNGDSCTCGDYAKNIKRDPDFKCKHILAVFNAVPSVKSKALYSSKSRCPNWMNAGSPRSKGRNLSNTLVYWIWHINMVFPASRSILFRCPPRITEILLCAGQRSCRRSERPIPTSGMPIQGIVPARYPNIC